MALYNTIFGGPDLQPPTPGDIIFGNYKERPRQTPGNTIFPEGPAADAADADATNTASSRQNRVAAASQRRADVQVARQERLLGQDMSSLGSA